MTRNLIAFLMLFILLSTSGNAQVNLNNQVLVYFQSGVQRNAPANTTATISSANILNLLNTYGIPASNVVPSFPAFNESDTVSYEIGEESRQMNRAKVFTITIVDPSTKDNFINSLNVMSEVVYAETNGEITANVIPVDGRFPQQWGLRNTIVPGADIHATQAWDIFTGNPNAIIAVIDDGVDATHNDVNVKILGGDNGFLITQDGLGRPISHGSHIAGIAAAISNNAGNNGVAGVDWQARIHPKNIYNGLGDPYITQKIIDAVNFSPNVWTLTNSWSMNKQNGTEGRYSRTVRSAFAHAYRNNRVSCVGMGNHHTGLLPTADDVMGYPAGFSSGIIAVGASDINDTVAVFSARGSHIDVSAPGVGIWSTNYNNDYIDLSGTSMATPYVAGLASLLKGFNTNLANDDIEQIIRLTADDVNAINNLPGFDNQMGAGRINAHRALQSLQAPNTLQQLSTTGGTVFSTTSNLIRTFLGVPHFGDGVYFGMERIEVRKDIIFPSMCKIVGVWGRGVGTTGYGEQYGTCYGEGICEVVPGTLTNTGCTLRTYVYFFASTYFPTNPGNVVFQYTILGVPGPSQINGDNSVCGISNNYTVLNLPSGTSVNWQATPNQIVTIDAPYATQTKLISYANGIITLTANISGISCNVSISKPNIIVTGPPTITCQTIGNGSCNQQITLCPSQLNTWQYFSIPNYNPPGAAGFQLTAFGGGYFSGGASVINVSTDYWATHDIGVFVPNNGNNSTDCNVTVRAVNCGVSQYVPYVVTFPVMTYGCGYSSYSVSPNPATSTITVSPNTKVSSAQNKAEKTPFTEIEIIDKLGNFKKRLKFSKGTNTATIDISFLPTDTYLVRVFNGTNWEEYKILVAK
ncbi:MAG: S8 family serine peptidase [Sediminibacterium sp.]|nr:S8 family serine peptidase [Sediminibacterium sp.]